MEGERARKSHIYPRGRAQNFPESYGGLWLVGISHTYLDDSHLASLDFRGLANLIFTPGMELGIFSKSHGGLWLVGMSYGGLWLVSPRTSTRRLLKLTENSNYASSKTSPSIFLRAQKYKFADKIYQLSRSTSHLVFKLRNRITREIQATIDILLITSKSQTASPRKIKN